MLLLHIDGYALAVRRTDPHFFVDGFVGRSYYSDCLNGYVYLSIRFVDLVFDSHIEYLQPPPRLEDNAFWVAVDRQEKRDLPFP
jgi:hypothetical protein